MHGCTAVIADAAQFYEEVSQDEIVKALRWVTRRAKRLNVHVVTGFQRKRLRGFASTHRPTHVRTVDVWTPRQIELALLLTQSQIYFSVPGAHPSKTGTALGQRRERNVPKTCRTPVHCPPGPGHYSATHPNCWANHPLDAAPPLLQRTPGNPSGMGYACGAGWPNQSTSAQVRRLVRILLRPQPSPAKGPPAPVPEPEWFSTSDA